MVCKSVAVLLFVMASGLYGGDFCGLTVSVLRFDMGRAEGIEVQLKEGDRTVAVGITGKSGDVLFCDFGYEPHSVRVVDHRCNDISVENLTIDPAKQRNVKVLLNHCFEPMGSPDACFTMIRVHSTTGDPIPEATFGYELDQVRIMANKFGVLHFAVHTGEYHVVVSASGYVAKWIRLSCIGASSIREAVTLERTR